MSVSKSRVVAREAEGYVGAKAYFAQLINLQFKFGAVFVLLDRTQKEIYLGNNNLRQGACPSRTAGAGAGTSTEGSRVRRMRRVNGSSLQV
jgi:hypothetical protein